MKIHFCDLCNESVPQADLDQGRAFIRKGRVMCAACDRAMTHREEEEARAGAALSASSGGGSSTASAIALARSIDAPARDVASPAFVPPGPVPSPSSSPTPATATASSGVGSGKSSGSGAMWMAVLGLLFTAGAIFVLNDGIHDLRSSQESMRNTLDTHVRVVKTQQTELAAALAAHKDLDARVATRAELDGKARSELAERLAALSKAIDATAASQAALAQDVSVLREKAGTGGMDLEKRFVELSARIAKEEDERRLLIERLLKLENAPAVAPAAVAAADPAKPAEPAWHALTEDLKSASESTRWSAVDELGKTNDPAIAPFVIPILKDPNVFVRMGAARVLGNVKAKVAVGPLIDALEDADSAMRDAAFVALRTITGKDLAFSALGTEAERAKRVKAWREWFKKEPEAGT